MSSGRNRLMDEIAKLMTGAAGAAQGVRREAENVFRSQSEKMVNSMDLVQREEYEAMRDMAAKARNQADALEVRLSALEKRVDKLHPTGKAASSSSSPKTTSATTSKSGSKTSSPSRKKPASSGAKKPASPRKAPQTKKTS